VTVLAFPAQPGPAESQPDETRLVTEWSEWLRERLAPQWRPSEWTESQLVFVGDPNNPRTSVGACAVVGCGVPVAVLAKGYCVPCRDAFKVSGLTREEFEATHKREFHRGNVSRGSLPCAVPVCARTVTADDLCLSHYRSWVKVRKRRDKAEWIANRNALAAKEACQVVGCPRERVGVDGLCRTHRNKWRGWAAAEGLDENDRARAAQWSERQVPVLAAHMFSLAPLHPVARAEMLYVLQQRDSRGRNLAPQAVRGAVTRLASLSSLALAGDDYSDCQWRGASVPIGMADGTRGLLAAVRWELTTAFNQFRGADPTQAHVWDLRTVSQVIPSLKKGVCPLRNASSLDFGEVRQEWLRHALMHWARTASPVKIGRAHV
jgi:hypothetical protein